MAAPQFLALDLGAESGRAILGSLERQRLQIKEISRFPNQMLPIHGHLYWNVFRLFEEVRKGLGICLAEIKVNSLALDTWGVDFGFLAEDGTIIGLPFAYRDPHTKGIMEEFFEKIPEKKVYQLTGIQFLQFNSLFQLYAMKKEKSSLLEAAADLLFMPDLFNYLLTGKKKTEFTFATTSQLYNPTKGDWEEELFKALEIPKTLVQEIVQPGTIIGELDYNISQTYRVDPMLVVAVASHDTGSAVAAVPATGQDWAYISSGTWSLMGIETQMPIINDRAMALNFTNEGGVDGTFRFLKNITGLWLLQECRNAWAKEKDYSYERLINLAQQTEAFQFFINPDWEGFLNPPDMPEAIRKYCVLTKQKTPGSPAEFVRCVLESLALKYRVVLDQLRQIHSQPIRKVHIIGGGVKNRLLCQFTANATGLPVYAGPIEATSIGNIMMQALTLGVVHSVQEMREVIRRSFELTFYEPEHMDEWDRARDQFLEIIDLE
jgi:rhamnulokinase